MESRQQCVDTADRHARIEQQGRTLREPPSGMGTQDEVPSGRVRRNDRRNQLAASIYSTVFRPVFDHHGRISSTSKVQIADAKTLNNKGGLVRQVRCFASHSYLYASRQFNSLVQDGWLSHIRTPFSPKPGERTRGIHADGRRSVRMRSPAWSGRIGSWLEHAMSLRRAGTFSPVHTVFSPCP